MAAAAAPAAEAEAEAEAAAETETEAETGSITTGAKHLNTAIFRNKGDGGTDIK